MLYRAQKGEPISNSFHKKFEITKKIFSFSNGLNSTFPFSIVLSNFLKFCCHCFYVFFERRWWYGLFVRDDVDNSVWSFGWPGDRYMGNKYSLLSTYNYFRLKTPPEPLHTWAKFNYLCCTLGSESRVMPIPPFPTDNLHWLLLLYMTSLAIQLIWILFVSMLQ